MATLIEAKKASLVYGPVFVLGWGLLEPDPSELSGSFRFVGLKRPGHAHFEPIPPVHGGTWLSELGPGRLVFIPDDADVTMDEIG